MPFITIDTNSELAASPEMFMEVLETASVILNKPRSAFIIKINTGKQLLCGPEASSIGALVEVKSIGYNGKISELAQTLTALIAKWFDAEPQLVGIHFVDMPATNAAHGGSPMA